MQTVDGLNKLVKTRTLIGLVALILAVSGCSSPSPVAPGTTRPVSEGAALFATISGQVYANVTWADPPIAEATIEVTAADGSIKTTLSDDNGLYTISVRGGNVSITASKDGYETKSWQLALVKDLVLNFGLAPN